MSKWSMRNVDPSTSAQPAKDTAPTPIRHGSPPTLQTVPGMARHCHTSSASTVFEART